VRQAKPSILTCAVTGAGLTPSMSPHLPISPAEIAEQAIAAAKAGASMLHLHARTPDGRPTNEIDVWREFIPEIRENTDAIINMSASFGPTAEERLKAVLDLRPDVATVIVGSMNYGRFKKAVDLNISEFKYDWEKEYLFGENAYTLVTQNTFAKIGRMIETLVDHDIGIEFECYDVGHLYILDYHLQKIQNVKRPLIVQFLTGILGGIPSGLEHLMHLKQTAERLFGNDVELFTHGTGPHNMTAATIGALMGTNIRVGQEDNIQEKPGVLFPSNAAQIHKVKRILGELNIEVADVAEARQRLKLQ